MPDRTGHAEDSGQSLIEAGLLVPFLIVLVFNAINIGYYFFAALNLSTAPRQGAEYSIQGSASSVGSQLPSAGSVSTLVYDGIDRSISGTSSAPMQVCSKSVGVSGGLAQCIQYNGFSSSAPDADPEQPSLVLNRVDIQYHVDPPIPGSLFNIVPAPTIHRYVEMRAVD